MAGESPRRGSGRFLTLRQVGTRPSAVSAVKTCLAGEAEASKPTERILKRCPMSRTSVLPEVFLVRRNFSTTGSPTLRSGRSSFTRGSPLIPTSLTTLSMGFLRPAEKSTSRVTLALYRTLGSGVDIEVSFLSIQRRDTSGNRGPRLPGLLPSSQRAKRLSSPSEGVCLRKACLPAESDRSREGCLSELSSPSALSRGLIGPEPGKTLREEGSLCEGSVSKHSRRTIPHHGNTEPTESLYQEVFSGSVPPCWSVSSPRGSPLPGDLFIDHRSGDLSQGDLFIDQGISQRIISGYVPKAG